MTGVARRVPPVHSRSLDSLSISQARRVALAAHGFGRARPAGVANRGQVRRLVDQLKVVQIDSVNVLARAHEMPLWSRLGAYRRGVLDEMVRRRELFEYWAHQASYSPVEHWPLFQWKMASPRTGHGRKYMDELERTRPGFVAEVYDAVKTRGAVTAGEWERERPPGPWWDWSDAKFVLEQLFVMGKITVRRRSNFEREYVLPESVIPAAILAAPAVPESEARRILLERAAQAIGVGTEADLCYYFKLLPTASRDALRSLVDDGLLREVSVEGWGRQRAYMHRDARMPRRIDAAAVLSPFDPVVWERARNERLLDFHYRIEIYTPAAKRVHGYYVLPFLLGERIVARVDLKADRAARVLRVPGAYTEEHAKAGDVAPALAQELHALAAWLELDGIEVEPRGDLSRRLLAEL
jgi:uncharacterized protein YcaQ